MKKLITVVVLLLALTVSLFAFTACDSGSDKETIVVGYTIYEPMNYKDENGTLIGFDTELACKVFENLGYEVIMKEINWDSKYVDLKAGTIDCIWNGFTSNGEDDGTPRAELVDFTYNYMLNAQSVVVKTSEAGKYTDMATSFNGKQGASEAGSAGLSYLTDNFTGAVSKEVTKQTDALMEVKSGASSFAVVDKLLAESMVGQGDYANLTILTSFTSEAEYYAVAFEKGSDLTAKVNAEFVKLADDGYIAELGAKYGVENTAIKDFSDQM